MKLPYTFHDYNNPANDLVGVHMQQTSEDSAGDLYKRLAVTGEQGVGIVMDSTTDAGKPSLDLIVEPSFIPLV